jgi:hypothetical protein
MPDFFNEQSRIIIRNLFEAFKASFTIHYASFICLALFGSGFLYYFGILISKQQVKEREKSITKAQKYAVGTCIGFIVTLGLIFGYKHINVKVSNILKLFSLHWFFTYILLFLALGFSKLIFIVNYSFGFKFLLFFDFIYFCLMPGYEQAIAFLIANFIVCCALLFPVILQSANVFRHRVTLTISFLIKDLQNISIILSIAAMIQASFVYIVFKSIPDYYHNIANLNIYLCLSLFIFFFFRLTNIINDRYITLLYCYDSYSDSPTTPLTSHFSLFFTDIFKSIFHSLKPAFFLSSFDLLLLLLSISNFYRLSDDISIFSVSLLTLSYLILQYFSVFFSFSDNFKLIFKMIFKFNQKANRKTNFHLDDKFNYLNMFLHTEIINSNYSMMLFIATKILKQNSYFHYQSVSIQSFIENLIFNLVDLNNNDISDVAGIVKQFKFHNVFLFFFFLSFIHIIMTLYNVISIYENELHEESTHKVIQNKSLTKDDLLGETLI